MKYETPILPPTGQVVPQGGKTVEGFGAVASREMKDVNFKEKESVSDLVEYGKEKNNVSQNQFGCRNINQKIKNNERRKKCFVEMSQLKNKEFDIKEELRMMRKEIDRMIIQKEFINSR
jgi:hypothetical protein